MAREEFSLSGYGTATNRGIASMAGITSGALYHYFESKLDLYLAVYEDVRREILDVLTRAIESETTFVNQFAAILDATKVMNDLDPSVGRFNGSVRVDMQRHADIAAAVRKKKDPIASFFKRLIRAAVDSGEIRETDVALVEAFVLMTLLGITAGLADDRRFQATANEAVKRVMAGRLLG